MQFTPVSNLSLHSFLQMPPCSPTLLFHHSIIMEEFDSWDWPPQFSSHSLACFLSLLMQCINCDQGPYHHLLGCGPKPPCTMRACIRSYKSIHFSTVSLTGASWFLLACPYKKGLSEKAQWSVTQEQQNPKRQATYFKSQNSCKCNQSLSGGRKRKLVKLNRSCKGKHGHQNTHRKKCSALIADMFKTIAWQPSTGCSPCYFF